MTMNYQDRHEQLIQVVIMTQMRGQVRGCSRLRNQRRLVYRSTDVQEEHIFQADPRSPA